MEQTCAVNIYGIDPDDLSGEQRRELCSAVMDVLRDNHGLRPTGTGFEQFDN